METSTIQQQTEYDLESTPGPFWTAFFGNRNRSEHINTTRETYPAMSQSPNRKRDISGEYLNRSEENCDSTTMEEATQTSSLAEDMQNMLHLNDSHYQPLDDFQTVFFKEAILDIYRVREEGEALWLLPEVYNSQVSLAEFEVMVAKVARTLNEETRDLNLSATLPCAKRDKKIIKWKCQVVLNPDDPLDHNYKVSFLPPEIDKATCLYQWKFGYDRFLYVTISGIPPLEDSSFNRPSSSEFWAATKLFENGIQFANQTYFFLGGEPAEAKTIQNFLNGGSQVGNDSSKKFNSIVGWFFCERFPIQGATRDLIPTVNVRDYLGDLSRERAGKCNARLKLGFSPIHPVVIDDDQVSVIPDVASSLGNGDIMTDGCGLIGIELAKTIPYGIQNGVAAQNREQDMPSPIMIQIRCISKLGLFKGCLLVTADSRLCSPREIKFRESMKKANSSKLFPPGRPILGVSKTFEHPQQLQLEKKRGKNDYSVRLNKELCLLLHYLKVPTSYFLQLMETELSLMKNCLRTPADTMKFVRNTIKQWKAQQLNPMLEIEEDFSEDLDEESDCTVVLDDSDDISISENLYGFLRPEQETINIANSVDVDTELFRRQLKLRSELMSTAAMANAMMLRSALLAGMQIEECQMNKYLMVLFRKRWQEMLQFKLQVKNALYLVGAPDPYQYLAPNEVYISLPNDRHTIIPNSEYLNCKNVKGKVVVTRHPLTHPGDIRVFTAVSHPQLQSQSIASSNGGVIVFSTQGSRAPADMMSGGDYDGDDFLVIYNDEDGLLDHVQPIDPYIESVQPLEPSQKEDMAPTFQGCGHVKDGRCRNCGDSLGVTILCSLLKIAQRHLVESYSNAWFKWTDRDPLCSQALDCGRIKKIALDAPKTGKLIPDRPDLLNIPYPYYLDFGNQSNSNFQQSPARPNRHHKTDYNNSSVLKLLYDLAMDRLKSLQNEYDTRIIASWKSNPTAPASPLLFDLDCMIVLDLDFDPQYASSGFVLPQSLLSTYCKVENQPLYSVREFYDSVSKMNLLPSKCMAVLIEFSDKISSYKSSLNQVLSRFPSHPNRRYKDYTETAILKNGAINDLKVSHYQQFIELVRKCHQENPTIPYKLLRLRIAGILYLGTYLKAEEKSSYSTDPSYAVSYCWEICSSELLYNKHQMYLRRNGRSLFELTNPMDLNHWC